MTINCTKNIEPFSSSLPDRPVMSLHFLIITGRKHKHAYYWNFSLKALAKYYINQKNAVGVTQCQDPKSRSTRVESLKPIFAPNVINLLPNLSLIRASRAGSNLNYTYCHPYISTYERKFVKFPPLILFRAKHGLQMWMKKTSASPNVPKR